MKSESNRCSFFIQCNPAGKARPRLGRGGRVYTPKKTADLELLIKKTVMVHRPVKLEGPIAAEIEFIFARPKTVKRKYHTIAPDLDNCIKLTLDALNKVLYDDDSAICSIHAIKRYVSDVELELPGIRISLESHQQI